MLTPEQYAAALDALRSGGLQIDEIEFDGQMHRVPTKDKPNSKNGAYVAYGDAPVSVWWKNWATDEESTWTANGESNLTPEERAELSRRMEEARKEREAEQARIHAEAANKAQSLHSAAAICTEHSYLTTKGVKPVPGLKVGADGYGNKGALLVPVRNADGAIVSIQSIPATPGTDGKWAKLFLKGGQKKGCYFFIGGRDTDKPLVICEGVATGLSIFECLGLPVLVAFDAGNLLSVAEMARAKYPDREIVLAADNDIETDGNPGVTKATTAAIAIDGVLSVPNYQGAAVDWNDLHQKMNAGEVRTQFMNRQKPVQSKGEPRSDQDLPSGFSIRSGGTLPGLWHIDHKEDGDPVETWIGPALHVLGATRDDNGNSWGLLLEWNDPDGRRHTWAMPKALLVGREDSAWLGRLADEGWSGAPGSRARKLLALYLATSSPENRILCVPCTGWHRGAFVFPDNTLLNSAGRAGRAGQANGENDLMPSSNETGLLDVLDGEQIVLQVQTPHNPFCMAGTLEGWQASIGEWSLGNSRLMLALCASFAAPLLEIAGQESGGFNFTGQSSTGKTTALVAAGSVWGKGSSSGGYIQNWRATSNGLEGLAALHSDAALCLDEIGQAPGRTIIEAAYMLANGMGKARAFQDGSAKNVKSWRCMVLSTGEKGLAEKIAEEGGKVQAGQAVRLIDIPADAGAGMGIFEEIHRHESPRAFADALKLAASTHYGHAARAFIFEIQNRHQNIRDELLAALATAGDLFCPAGSSGQVERVARRFTLCAAAGEMAAEWSLLPWQKGEAFQSVKKCFDDWLAFRGGFGAAEDSAILEQVKLFIEQHGASRFQDIDRPAATCINRVGFRRDTENGTEFYILPESFRTEVCKGHNPKRASALLLESGLLLPGDSRSHTRKPSFDLPEFKRRRCYTLLIGGETNELA